MILRLISLQRARFSRPSYRPYETPVQSGLAISPSDMLEMTKRGIPITPQNLGLSYDEGYNDLDFNPPIEYQRGIDIGTLWEERQSAKSRIKDGMKKHLSNIQKTE